MKWWHVAIAGGCLLAAFALGRWSARTPDVILEEQMEESVRAQVVEVFGQREEWVTARDLSHQRDEARVVYREWRPDGSVTELEATASSDRVHEVAAAAGAREAQQARVEVLEVQREVMRTVTVSTPAPNWRLSALGGWDVQGGKLTYGAHLERRILGPVAVGAWGISSRAVGVSVGITW